MKGLAELYQPRPQPKAWADPKNHDACLVNVSATCGPSWWAMLHGWAEAIRSQGCSHCGGEAAGMASFLHDHVNLKLGKPLHEARNFAQWLGRFGEDAKKLKLPDALNLGEPRQSKVADGQAFIAAAEKLPFTQRERVFALYATPAGIVPECLSEGSAGESTVPIHRVLSRGAQLGATGFALVHNHPSGASYPSREDVEISRILESEGGKAGLPMLDHLIVANGRASSLMRTRAVSLRQQLTFPGIFGPPGQPAPAPPVPGSPPPDVVPGRGTVYRLYPFQEQGVAFLKDKEAALLADDMGLGKTPQAIYWGAERQPALVVVPAAILYNWQEELTEKWRPSDGVLLLLGQPLPRKLPAWTIMTYGMLPRYLPSLRRAGFRSIIIDEAQAIKNMDARRTRNVLDLVAPLKPLATDKLIPSRLAVTGTPIMNRPPELFPILAFLGKEPRSGYDRWLSRFAVMERHGLRLEFTGWRGLDTMHRELKPFMVRRCKEEVLTQLPKKIYRPIYTALTNAEEYLNAERDFLTWLQKNVGQEAVARIEFSIRAQALVKMNYLRQLAAKGKVGPVLDFLKPCTETGHKVIAFSNFIEVVDALKTAKPDSVLVKGDTEKAERAQAVKKFQTDPATCFFFGTVGAAGVGITLTAADRVVFVDLPWTPGGKAQAEDRAHRIGQTKPLEVIPFLARGTIDERIMQIIAEKEVTIAQAIDGLDKDMALQSSISSQLLGQFLGMVREGRAPERPPQYLSEQDIITIEGVRQPQPGAFQYSTEPLPPLTLRQGAETVIPPEYREAQVETRVERRAAWSQEQAPAFTNPQSFQPLFSLMRHADREFLLAIYLDVRLKIIGMQELAIGQRSEVSFPLDAFLRSGILLNADNIVFAHNHPSGDPSPSEPDMRAWSTVKRSAELQNMKVLDFLVVGKDADYSIASSRRMPLTPEAPSLAFIDPPEYGRPLQPSVLPARPLVPERSGPRGQRRLFSPGNRVKQPPAPVAIRVSGRCPATGDECTFGVKREVPTARATGIEALRRSIEAALAPPPAPRPAPTAGPAFQPMTVELGGTTYTFAPETLREMVRVADTTKEKEKGFLLCSSKDGTMVPGKHCTGGACSIHITDCAGGERAGRFHTHPNQGAYEPAIQSAYQRIFSVGDLSHDRQLTCISGPSSDRVVCATLKEGKSPPKLLQRNQRDVPYFVPEVPDAMKAATISAGRFYPSVGRRYDYAQISKADIMGRGYKLPAEPPGGKWTISASPPVRLFQRYDHAQPVVYVGQATAHVPGPLVRIAGRCTGDASTCTFQVKGANEASERATSPEQIADAVNAVRQVLVAKQITFIPPEEGKRARPKPEKPDARAFALGPSGRRYEFLYQAVPLADLVTSHDPFTFVPSPAFAQKLQPRLRDRAATQLQVERMAAELDPALLLTEFHAIDRGAPIVGPDMLVESGNGRVMALKRAIRDHPEAFARYSQAAADFARVRNLAVAGTTPNQAVVRVRTTPLTDSERQAFVQEANLPPGISQSAIEKARQDAERVTLEMLEGLEVGDGQSIEEALRSLRNNTFVLSFLASIPETEQAQLVDAQGKVNQDGVRRLALAVFVATFPGGPGLRLAERFFESVDPTVRNVANGIGMALGSLAVSEGLARSGARERQLSIGEDLAKAVTVFARIKATVDATVVKYLAQQTFLTPELDAFQRGLLVALEERARSGKRLGDLLKAYARLVTESPPPQQAGLFGERAPISKEALWKSAIARAERGEPVLADVLAGVERSHLHFNVSPSTRQQITAYRPLREWLFLAAQAKSVDVRHGLLGDTVIITVSGGEKVKGELERLALSFMPRNARLVASQDPGELGLEVRLPRETVDISELLGGKQTITIKPKQEYAEQPRLMAPVASVALQPWTPLYLVGVDLVDDIEIELVEA